MKNRWIIGGVAALLAASASVGCAPPDGAAPGGGPNGPRPVPADQVPTARPALPALPEVAGWGSRPVITENGLTVVANQAVVRFDASLDEAGVRAAAARAGARVVGRVPGIADVALLEFPSATGAAAMNEQLRRAGGAVVGAEENALARGCAAPSDPLYALQWNLPAIRLEAARDRVSSARGVVVAVLDSGLARGVPELAGATIASGYDFVNGDADPADDNGHGTAIATILAADTDDGAGMAGVAPGVTILPVKVLDASLVGSEFTLAQGIMYAVENGAQAIVVASAFPRGYTPGVLLRVAVERAHVRNIPILAASGNDAGDTVLYPAAFPEVIAVGATQPAGPRGAFAVAPYSTRGAALDVVAPGGALAGDADGDGFIDAILGQTTAGGGAPGFEYRYFVGTSFAAAHAGGIAALLLASGASGAGVHPALAASARDILAPGYDAASANGAVDAARAIDVRSTATLPELLVGTSIDRRQGRTPGGAVQVQVTDTQFRPRDRVLVTGHFFGAVIVGGQCVTNSQGECTIQAPDQLEGACDRGRVTSVYGFQVDAVVDGKAAPPFGELTPVDELRALRSGARPGRRLDLAFTALPRMGRYVAEMAPRSGLDAIRSISLPGTMLAQLPLLNGTGVGGTPTGYGFGRLLRYLDGQQFGNAVSLRAICHPGSLFAGP